VIHGRKAYHQKSTTLYDVGGWLIILAIMGGVYFIGIILDYFWNYLVLFFSLRRLHFDINTKRRFIYCLIITGLGLAIDCIYYELSWSKAIGIIYIGSLRLPSLFPQPGSQPILELFTIFVPMIMLVLVNFVVSRLYLRMVARQAIVLVVRSWVFLPLRG